MILNSQDNRITLSTVVFTDTDKIIGEGAVTQRARDPYNVVFSAKRLIGKIPLSRPTLESIYSKSSQMIKKSTSRSRSKRKKLMTPEEFSAAVLTEMKKTARR